MKKVLKILFVEDLSSDIELAERILKKDGFEFQSLAVSIEKDFIRELKDFNPDIVISDYRMPAFDGMKALKITLEKTPYIPFVLLTGSMNEEIAVDCMKAGASDYVIKEHIKRLPLAVREAIEKKKIILEKHQAEAELKKSEERFRRLAENAQDLIYRYELYPKRGFVYVSPAAEGITGYSPEEHYADHDLGFKIVHPDDRHLLESISNNSTEFHKTIELRWIKKNGDLIWTEQRNVPIYDEKGNIIAIEGIARDITVRKKIEEDLRKLSRAVEQSQAAVVITDLTGKTEYVNHKFCEITGYSKEEVVGNNPRILKSGHHDQKFYEELWNTIMSGNDWRGEILNKRKNGEMYWEYSLISPVEDKEGKISHFVAIKEDITREKKMLEEIVVAKEKAEESDRLKSAFLANMSHEIRTPMNSILGFINLLKSADITDYTRAEYISVIEKSGQRMLNTLNSLINISKIETGEIQIYPSPVNINSLLDELLKTFSLECEAKDLRLHLHKALPDEKVIVNTDNEKIHAIFTCLINNAIKFTDKGYVDFGYRMNAKNHKIIFFVRDSGIGISKTFQKKVFDRFLQEETGYTRKFEGAGLGLSISKAYVEKLGGEMWLEYSEPGKGSKFCFSLPYEYAMNKEDKVEIISDQDSVIPGRKLNILIAEDEKYAQTYLSIILKYVSNKVHFAKTGSETIEAFINNPDTDLIMMDIMMPVMDGYEATRKIREMNKDVVIIAQTAYAFSDDKEKALKAGCNDYISKPIIREELMEKIEKFFPAMT